MNKIKRKPTIGLKEIRKSYTKNDWDYEIWLRKYAWNREDLLELLMTFRRDLIHATKVH